MYAPTELCVTDSYRNSAMNIEVTRGFTGTCPTSGYSTPSGGVNCSWKLSVAAIRGTHL